jgi:hypothetical protein
MVPPPALGVPGVPGAAGLVGEPVVPPGEALVPGVVAAPDTLGAALPAALPEGLADDDDADEELDAAEEEGAVVAVADPPQAIRKALIAEAETPSTAARIMKSRRERRPSRKSESI